jgi:hypothetical protein
MMFKAVPRDPLYRFTAALIVPALVFYGIFAYDVFTHPASPGSWDGTPLFRWLCVLVYAPVTMAFGAFIMRRVPHNVIGVLLILWGVQNAAWSIRTDAPPLMDALGSLYGSIGLSAGLLLFILFPTGTPYPRRLGLWFSRYTYLMMALNALYILSGQQFTGLYAFIGSTNPLFIPALAPLKFILEPLSTIFIFAWFLVPVPLIIRYRHATHHERQQIKWLAYGITVSLPFFAAIVLVTAMTVRTDLMNLVDSLLRMTVYSYLNLLPALAIGAAILRYRLWDIDLIIRRTLIYSVITAILAMVYFGGVAVMQGVFVALTGQESPLAVVASTLAIAALFTPVRRRVQEVIDRRFFRRKYDAEKTVDAFARTVRDEVDIDCVREALLDAVADTMQPEHVSLWMAPAESARPGR